MSRNYLIRLFHSCGTKGLRHHNYNSYQESYSYGYSKSFHIFLGSDTQIIATTTMNGISHMLVGVLREAVCLYRNCLISFEEDLIELVYKSFWVGNRANS